ncbi:S9 family peptidase [Halobacteriales archaeon QS_1_68_20]|nr:MAG: S9 family peptidase [Halobacteriales archaeon QS_1_68_20]
MDGPDLSLEALGSLPEFYHPIVSPVGDRVALYYDESGRNELYVLDADTGEYERLTDGEVPRDANWLKRWSDGGDRVYVHRDHDGDEQYDVLSVALDGTVETVVRVDGQAVLRDVADDGRTLLYTSDQAGQPNLYRYDREADETTRLTEYGRPVSGGAFSPSGDRIAYRVNESAELNNLDLYVMAADGADARRLPVGSEGSEVGFGGWFPDGQRVLVSDDDDGLRRVGTYDLGEESVRWFGPDDPDRRHEESAVAVGPDGDVVLAARDRRAARMPVAYDVRTGEGRELDVPEGFLSLSSSVGGTFVDGSTVVFAHSSADRRKRLLEYDLDSDASGVLLNATYGDVDPATFVDAEYVTYESEDGLTVGGLLYVPREEESGEEDLPAVVSVHGGPHSRAYRRFDVYVQFLVSRGYAVFRPNYRGSTGRGREFERAIHHDWGGMEQADVAAAGRWLAGHDRIDADRIAVFGRSFGGYSVYCQLTQYPRLWATGVAWMGITDLHRLYDAVPSYVQHYLRRQMGDPEENRDRWRERSPVEHVEEMERPVLILHGVNDPRCPVEQARVFRDKLEARGWELGTDFEYRELDGQGHGSTDADQTVQVFELLDAYLDRRL